MSNFGPGTLVSVVTSSQRGGQGGHHSHLTSLSLSPPQSWLSRESRTRVIDMKLSKMSMTMCATYGWASHHSAGIICYSALIGPMLWLVYSALIGQMLWLVYSALIGQMLWLVYSALIGQMAQSAVTGLLWSDWSVCRDWSTAYSTYQKPNSHIWISIWARVRVLWKFMKSGFTVTAHLLTKQHILDMLTTRTKLFQSQLQLQC